MSHNPIYHNPLTCIILCILQVKVRYRTHLVCNLFLISFRMHVSMEICNMVAVEIEGLFNQRACGLISWLFSPGYALTESLDSASATQLSSLWM